MYPCPNPNVCGVQNHREGTQCRASNGAGRVSRSNKGEAIRSMQMMQGITTPKSAAKRSSKLSGEELIAQKESEWFDGEMGEYTESTGEPDKNGDVEAVCIEDFEHRGKSFSEGDNITVHLDSWEVSPRD